MQRRRSERGRRIGGGSAGGARRRRARASAAGLFSALVPLLIPFAAPAQSPDSAETEAVDAEAAPAPDPAAGAPSAAEPPAATDPAVPAAAPPPPIGTRYAEPLEGQRLRIAYQFQRTKLQGLLRADRDTGPGFVRANSVDPAYSETPRALDLTVHRIEVAYAPHPRTTLVLQVPFAVRDLETIEGATGDRRRDQTDGVGDVQLALVVPFIRKGRESSHVHVAFDAPSGSYRKRDDDGRRLPYDLQLGNGTVDFEWGWTYRGAWDRLAWGGQAVGRHPLAENGLDYREGSRFEASLWGGVELIEGVSASLRVQWQKQNNLRKRDRGLDPIVSPAENGKARGGTRFLMGPGLAFEIPGAPGQRLAVEAAIPVHQDLDGPQLEQDWTLTTGWQWTF